MQARQLTSRLEEISSRKMELEAGRGSGKDVVHVMVLFFWGGYEAAKLMIRHDLINKTYNVI